MKIKVAINGFGRIGRLFLRQLLLHKNSPLKVVAVNDVVPPESLAYLFKYDSTHGQFVGQVETKGENLIIDGESIKILSEKDPSKLPWKAMGVDYVIESTGLFTKEEEAKKHLIAGAKRVIITAPAKGAIKTFVMGVNEEKYDPAKDAIVSNASCTTNCVAIISKVLLENFGIEEGLMTTVHATTATQPSVDAPSKKDLRGGRGASQNIIPASTGAAKSVGECLPEVKGKMTGMAFRVPVADVSVVDLSVKLKESTTYEEICKKMKEASENELKGLLAYTDEQVVSSDFIGTTYSAIFDALAGIELTDKFFKIIAWYDNEMGYAARVVDFAEYMAKREKKE